MLKKIALLAMMAILAIMTILAMTAPAVGAPKLRSNHPFIGTWQITMPDGSCRETYRVRADGTTLVFSNQEVAESRFEIADQPDRQGFYKQADTIVKDNGKLDCTGQVTKPGRSVTNYLLFHPGGDMFLMCVERSLERCIGPFLRVRGLAI